jgi:hypothetical protein
MPILKTPTLSNHQPKLMLGILGRLLQPLVRLLLAHGVGYPAVLEVLKRTYVSVAQDHFIPDPNTRTDSRISLLTGVHRKDIKRLREETTPNHEPQKEPLSAQVLSRWLGHPDFLNAEQKPKPLPKRGSPTQPGFEELVSALSKDIRPRVLLDEWLSTGLVTQQEGLYHLHPEHLFTKPAWQEQLNHLCANVHDHCAAAVHNVLPPSGTPHTYFFERNVFEEHLTQKQTEAIQDLVAHKGMDFLQAVNAKHHALATCTSAQENAPQYRINTGVYVYVEAMPKAEQSHE